MKTIKFTSVLALILLMCMLAFSVCNMLKPAYEGKSKVFTTQDLEITLTDSFFESENDERDFFYLSTSCGATGFKEHWTDLFESESKSISDYASLVREANSSLDPSEVKTENGLTYIECKMLDNDKTEWTYFLTFMKNDGYFWTIQFHCMTEEYQAFKPYFFEWANSISFK
jgi:hypothetical protein